MFGLGKKKSQNQPEHIDEKSRLESGLRKTRRSLFGGLFGKKHIDEDLLEELESRLIMADMGLEIVDKILEQVRSRLARNALADKAALIAAVRAQMLEILVKVEAPLVISDEKPFVLLVVGVNGAGKTTTIGKLAKKLQAKGHSVMLAAGDTFRAAAVEQLQTWGERNQVAVVAQGSGADSASVVFDAVSSAKAKATEVLIADTAGRLHTQEHLMAELEKISRVLKKHDASYPHETLLVLDASIGQNALVQAETFHKLLGVTGLVVSKMDGSAKGGVVFALAEKLGIPIRFVGVGESIEDLQTFHAETFVEAIIGTGEAHD